MLIYILLFLIFCFQTFRFFSLSNILQNQYYDLTRYLLYRKNHYLLLLLKGLIVFFSALLLFIHPYFSFLYLLFFIEKTPTKIKKFQWTSRIKRQFILFELLNLFNLIFVFAIENIEIKILLIYLYNILVYWISFYVSYWIEYCILKKNIHKAKEKLKAYHVTFIAITGSFGKTSCKNYISSFLKQKYNVLQTPKSYNTLNGILKTINEQLKPYHDVFIAEIGVDKINGMDKYIDIFPIHIGVVTKIGNQHLKTFKSILNIKKEKVKILQNALNYAIINQDDPYQDDVFISCHKITVSTHSSADIIVHIAKQDIDQTQLIVQIYNQTYTTYTQLIGLHNIENVACAIGVAKALNIEDDFILNTIKTLKNVKHRLSKTYANKWLLLDDSYNSNFIGFCNALDVLKQSSNRKVIITPGLIEQEKNEKQDKLLAQKINDSADLVILIKNPSFSPYILKKLDFDSFQEAYQYLKQHYIDQELTILIENDLPDIYIK